MRTAEEIARELESFYRHYIEVFNREDTDQLAGCFAYPYGSVSGERGLATVASADEHRNGFRRIMTALKQQGWARSGIDRIESWAMADDLGMIVSDVTRYQLDGSRLEKLRACYMVRRDGAAWKIVTLSEVKPPFRGPGDIPRS